MFTNRGTKSLENILKNIYQNYAKHVAPWVLKMIPIETEKYFQKLENVGRHLPYELPIA